MRRLTKSLICILTTLGSIGAFGAEEITHVSVIKADTKGEASLRRPLSTSITYPKVGDRLVLHAGKSGSYSFKVTQSKRSEMDDVVVRGETASSGKAILVLSTDGSITGNFVQHDGRVMVTTDKQGVVTAWREGIDAIARPIDYGPIVIEKSSHRQSQITKESPPTEANNRDSNLVLAQRTSDYKYPEFRRAPWEIGVLILYERGMNPYGVASYVKELTNDAFDASEIDLSIYYTSTWDVEIDPNIMHSDLLDAMRTNSPPFDDMLGDGFTSLDDLRLFNGYEGSDVVIFLRESANAKEESCGVAYLSVVEGIPAEAWAFGVAEWTPNSNGGAYCPDVTFTHELGHILGAAHNREEYDEPTTPALSYSYGYLTGGLSTIMAYAPRGVLDSYTFSDPDLLCGGNRCGVPASEPDSADNARTFRLTAPMVAGYRESEFETGSNSFYPELINIRKVTGRACTHEGSDGTWEGTNLYVDSPRGVKLHSINYVTSDGTVDSFDLDDELVGMGGLTGYGWCDTPERPSPLGDIYIESYYRYYDVYLGRFETGHILWEEDNDAPHSSIRVVDDDGAELIGHPERFARVGSTEQIAFDVTPGYEIESITSTCEGKQRSSSYLVEVTVDDCRIEVSSEKLFDALSVTPSATAGGTISPSSAQSVQSGSTVSFKLFPGDGFSLDTVDGTCGGTLTGTSFETSPVTADCTVHATFLQQSFRVTPDTNSGGALTPSEPQSVPFEVQAVFTINADEGYEADSVGGTCGGTFNGDTYTTAPITEDCTARINFRELPKHTVTASASEGGSVAFESEAIISEGSTATLIISADDLFYIGSVEGTCGGSLAENIFVTYPVTEDCSVQVKFTPDVGAMAEKQFIDLLDLIRGLFGG